MIPVSTNPVTFPPQTDISAVLGAPNPDALATQAFADPNSGFASGLHPGGVNDNKRGHFTLAAGISTAGHAIFAAMDAIQNIQQTLTSVQANVAALNNPNANPAFTGSNRLQLQNNLQQLSNQIDSANVDGINLLDASNSDGVTLDINGGSLTNAGKTPDTNVSGNDQRFAYQPDKVAYQTVDLRQAFNDLSNVLVQTYPGTDANTNEASGLPSVSNFQNTLNQASQALNSFKQSLSQAASDNLTVDTQGSDPTLQDGADAQQIASRLALELNQNSFNITANPAIKYFSLFA